MNPPHVSKILLRLGETLSLVSHHSAQLSHTIVFNLDALLSLFYRVSNFQPHHFILGDGEAAAKGTRNWFLWIMFTLLEVHCQDVQLDNNFTAELFIVTPLETIAMDMDNFEVIYTNLISHLANKFFRILGTGLNSAIDIELLETFN